MACVAVRCISTLSDKRHNFSEHKTCLLGILNWRIWQRIEMSECGGLRRPKLEFGSSAIKKEEEEEAEEEEEEGDNH